MNHIHNDITKYYDKMLTNIPNDYLVQFVIENYKEEVKEALKND